MKNTMKKTMKNTIIFLMGVSWSGKWTLMPKILDSYKNLSKIQSYVSRPMRDWEINGDKYFFISDQEFKEAIQNDEFLEYALVHKKYYYGTKIKEVQNKIDQGLIPIKELDILWLEKIKELDTLWKLSFDYLSIFLDIPEKIMIERINSRQEMPEEEIKRRITSASIEREKAKDICDYVIDASGSIEENLEKINKILREII